MRPHGALTKLASAGQRQVKDGKNMAKSVMVEKEEAASSDVSQTPPAPGATEEE